MTSGTRTIDMRSSRTQQNPSGVTTVYTGIYRTRTWNGGNDPVTPPTWILKPQVWTSRYLSKRKVLLRNGKSQITYVYNSRLRVSKVRVKPPKRATQRDPHPFTCTASRYKTGAVSYTIGKDTFTYSGIESLWSEEDPGTFSAQDELALLGRIRQKAVGSDFDPAVFLSQSHQSLRMIADAARRISGAWYAARRGRFDYAAKILTRGTDRAKFFDKKNPAGNWLELQYGWLPLLGDAASAAEWLAAQLDEPLVFPVKASYKVKVPLKSPSSHPLQNGWARSGWCERSCKAIVTLKEPPSTAVKLGITDPWSVIWENVPYSFVLDWFIPIGDYLSARALVRSLSVSKVVKSYRKVYVQAGFYANQDRIPGANGDGMSAWRQFTQVNRTVSTSLSLPPLTLKNFDQVPTWRRAANAVALIVQARKSS